MRGDVLLFCLLLLLAHTTGCKLTDASDELLSLFNIELERDFEYYDSKTDETVTGHLKISGNDVEYSDSLGNMGTGSLENETATAEFSGPEGSGSVWVEFSNLFEDYNGTISFDDGRVITFSG